VWAKTTQQCQLPQLGGARQMPIQHTNQGQVDRAVSCKIAAPADKAIKAKIIAAKF